MHVVVVESPAKAKTIGRYLGDGYRVFASYGHVSDLPAKDGSVRPEDGFAMTYVTARRANRVLSRIRAALKDAESLILATDPDREGEAIAWQVLTWLREKDAIGERPVHRVDFHEITEHGVREAMAQPREVDMDLVRAQQARRALDYLVGFHLSAVLWRKVPGSRSAGRVQSVALRLVCEREAEIESFVPQEYWTVDVQLEAAGGGSFTARPVLLDGSELDRLGIGTGTMAEDAARRIREGRFTVASVEGREIRRNPVPPFTTSTLQQEAARAALPARFLAPDAVTLPLAGIAEAPVLARRIEAATGLPVRLTGRAAEGAGASRRDSVAGIDRLSPEGGVWTGPLDALLDAWTRPAGYAWRYDEDREEIEIVRRQALAFRIHALAGRQRYAASASTDDGAEGGEEGGAVRTSQSIASETEYDPWPEIEAQTRALAGPGAVVAAAPSSASLLVAGTPGDLARVRAFLSWLNREVLRPVTLSVHVYSVRRERGADYGIGIAAAVAELFGTSAELAVSPESIALKPGPDMQNWLRS